MKFLHPTIRKVKRAVRQLSGKGSETLAGLE